MRKSEIIFGSIVLGMGVLLLFGAIFKVDVGRLICPAGLIALGVWLIYRTRRGPHHADVNLRFVGDIRRRGAWQVSDDETWGFVLDVNLDLREAALPEGETTFRVGAFVSDIDVILPAEVGIAITSMAFMTETRIDRQHDQQFFLPLEWQSANYASAARKINIKPTCFVAEIKITTEA
jgi:lia operon protein LiaF